MREHGAVLDWCAALSLNPGQFHPPRATQQAALLPEASLRQRSCSLTVGLCAMQERKRLFVAFKQHQAATRVADHGGAAAAGPAGEAANGAEARSSAAARGSVAFSAAPREGGAEPNDAARGSGGGASPCPTRAASPPACRPLPAAEAASTPPAAGGPPPPVLHLPPVSQLSPAKCTPPTHQRLGFTARFASRQQLQHVK